MVRSCLSSAGFTLAELLVVMVLLGLIGLLAAGGLRFGERAWEGATDRMARAATVRDAARALRVVVGGAVPAQGASEGNAGVGNAGVGLAGQAGQFKLRAHGPMGMADYSFILDEGGLEATVVLRVVAVPTAGGAGEAMRIVLPSAGDGASGLAAFAYRADGMAAGRWSSLWSADWPLPDLVRLRIGAVETVARVPLSHPSACSVVPKELGCDR